MRGYSFGVNVYTSVGGYPSSNDFANLTHDKCWFYSEKIHFSQRANIRVARLSSGQKHYRQFCSRSLFTDAAEAAKFECESPRLICISSF